MSSIVQLGLGLGTRQSPRRRRLSSSMRAIVRASTTTAREQPAWTGDDVLSKARSDPLKALPATSDFVVSYRPSPRQFVNLLIASPLYEPMKLVARQILINTATKNGVDWRSMRKALEAKQPAMDAARAAVEDPAVSYPSYYTVPFHAYRDGNMSWQAAYEVEPATYAMALRVYPTEGLSAEAAQSRLRSAYATALSDHAAGAGGRPLVDVLDVGCSTGISTRYLAAAFPQATVVGLDLSPYFLAVAAHQQPGRKWIHARAEATGLPTASLDAVSLAFVCHELPSAATRDIFREAARLLRPGGTLILCDNDPKSPVIQNLPAPIFTLMKSTEPHSDQYYGFDMEAELGAAGFTRVHTVRTSA